MALEARRPQPKPIGPYDIVSELHRSGSPGPLWVGSARAGIRADEPLLMRRVAGAEPALDAFQHAARELHAHVHRGWLRIEGVARDEDELVVASRYVEGEILAAIFQQSRVERRPIPLPIASRILSDLLESLEVAHQAGLMAAPGPEGIWIGTDGRARWLELGLANVAALHEPWRSRPTRAAYDPPERFADEPPTVSSDIFSLGTLFGEMLLGRPLFGGPTVEVVARRVSAAQVSMRAPGANGAIAPEVEQLLRRALGKEPEERFASAADFAAALAELPLARHVEVGIFVSEIAERALEAQRRKADRAVTGLQALEEEAASHRPPAMVSIPPGEESESPPASGRVQAMRRFEDAIALDPSSFAPDSSRSELDSFEQLVASERAGSEEPEEEVDTLAEIAREGSEAPAEPGTPPNLADDNTETPGQEGTHLDSDSEGSRRPEEAGARPGFGDEAGEGGEVSEEEAALPDLSAETAEASASEASTDLTADEPTGSAAGVGADGEDGLDGPPPESERRARARRIEDLEPAPLPADTPPPESGRRRASSAPPESGRRRASSAYLEIPASVSASPLPPAPQRNVRPLLIGGILGLAAVIITAFVIRAQRPPESAEEKDSATETSMPARGSAPSAKPASDEERAGEGERAGDGGARGDAPEGSEARPTEEGATPSASPSAESQALETAE